MPCRTLCRKDFSPPDAATLHGTAGQCNVIIVCCTLMVKLYNCGCCTCRRLWMNLTIMWRTWPLISEMDSELRKIPSLPNTMYVHLNCVAFALPPTLPIYIHIIPQWLSHYSDAVGTAGCKSFLKKNTHCRFSSKPLHRHQTLNLSVHGERNLKEGFHLPQKILCMYVQL